MPKNFVCGDTSGDETQCLALISADVVTMALTNECIIGIAVLIAIHWNTLAGSSREGLLALWLFKLSGFRGMS